MTEDAIACTHLDLVEIAARVGSDWPRLAKTLFLSSPASSDSDLSPSADNLVDWMTQRCGSADTLTSAGLIKEELRNDCDRALAVLLAWTLDAGECATG